MRISRRRSELFARNYSGGIIYAEGGKAPTTLPVFEIAGISVSSPLRRLGQCNNRSPAAAAVIRTDFGNRNSDSEYWTLAAECKVRKTVTKVPSQKNSVLVQLKWGTIPGYMYIDVFFSIYQLIKKNRRISLNCALFQFHTFCEKLRTFPLNEEKTRQACPDFSSLCISQPHISLILPLSSRTFDRILMRKKAGNVIWPILRRKGKYRKLLQSIVGAEISKFKF